MTKSSTLTRYPLVEFEDAFQDITGGQPKLQQRLYQNKGRFAVVDQGASLIGGFTDDDTLVATVQPPAIIFGDHTKIVKWIEGPFVLGADGVKILSPCHRLDKRFAYHFLKTVRLPDDAGYSRHYKFLKRIKVPVPKSMQEQVRIAAILDKADAIRVKRRKSLTEIDALLRATFLHMFGDPAINPKGWPTRAIGTAASVFSDGPFGSNLKSSHYVKSGVRVVRLQNIGVGEFIDDDKAFISEEHFQSLIKHKCLPGDILVGTLGEPNLRACLLPKKIAQALNKADCVQIRANNEIANADYLCGLLNMPSTEHLAQSLILGQTRSRISMGRLRDLVVPIPPTKLQEDYSTAVRKIEELREKKKLADADAGEAFHSLSHRAFRGEL
jgi:type I restriction enzyme S subunit